MVFVVLPSGISLTTRPLMDRIPSVHQELLLTLLSQLKDLQSLGLVPDSTEEVLLLLVLLQELRMVLVVPLSGISLTTRPLMDRIPSVHQEFLLTLLSQLKDLQSLGLVPDSMEEPLLVLVPHLELLLQ
jgi:hypothetical protein